MATLTVSPAYGRDYTSRAAALQDWQDGKDFRIEGFGHYSGAYTSSRDSANLKADGYDTISIRFKRMTQQAFVDL